MIVDRIFAPPAAALAARRWLWRHKISYDGLVSGEGYVCDETTD
jgi:hypothetical protein